MRWPIGSAESSPLSLARILTLVGGSTAIFSTTVGVLMPFPVTQLALAGAGMCVGWHCLWPKRSWVESKDEDLATGIYLTGMPGAGKSALLYVLIREWATQRRPWLYMSTKSTLSLLPFLPPEAVGNTTVVQPDGPNPIGVDFFRCYTGTPQERELVADQVAELFCRLHPAMSAIMRETLRLAALALLTWAHQEQKKVSFWELYRLFTQQSFRSKVLGSVSGPIRDGLEGDDVREATLAAVTVQLRRAVSSDSLLVSLCQTGGMDLWAWMQGNGGLIIDAPAGRVGLGISSFLAGAIAARVQLLTECRPPGSPLCLVACDEFQRYTSPTFGLALEVAREYRVCWALAHQTHAGQRLGEAVEGAVELAGNQIVLQQALPDARRAAELGGGRWTPEEITALPARHYRAKIRIHGRPTFVSGRTPDLPKPDYERARTILEASGRGPSREELLRSILGRRVERRGGVEGEPA